MTGWYSSQYDLPYIINRAKALNLDSRKLSPITQLKMYKKGDFYRIYLQGLDHIDMQFCRNNNIKVLSLSKNITANSKIRGGQSNHEYAEAFEILRWVDG